MQILHSALIPAKSAFHFSLYPSSQVLYCNMYGEYSVYSPTDPAKPEVLTNVSNYNPYGNEYRSCAMFRHELENHYGEEVLSIRSNHTNERRAVLPRFWPDAFAVTKTKDGKVVLNVLQHDGFSHVMESGLHHESCLYATPDNDFSNSVKYAYTLEAAARHQEYCEAVFGHKFQLRFIQTTDCNFHSPYTMNGVKYANMGLALGQVRYKRPELCISASHPSKLTLGEILSEERRSDNAILTGFAAVR